VVGDNAYSATEFTKRAVVFPQEVVDAAAARGIGLREYVISCMESRRAIDAAVHEAVRNLVLTGSSG